MYSRHGHDRQYQERDVPRSIRRDRVRARLDRELVGAEEISSTPALVRAEVATQRRVGKWYGRK